MDVLNLVAFFVLILFIFFISLNCKMDEQDWLDWYNGLTHTGCPPYLEFFWYFLGTKHSVAGLQVSRMT